MALPIAFNPIKISQIQTEFGGNAPTSLSEYYRNGLYTTPNNTNVPTSGEISMSDFYSAYRGYQVLIDFYREASNTNYFYLNSTGFPQIIITTPVDGGGSTLTYSIPTNVIYTITSNPGTIIRQNGNGMQLEDIPEIPAEYDWNDLEFYPREGTIFESGGNFYYVLDV